MTPVSVVHRGCGSGPWFARFPLWDLQETNGGPPAIRVDDGRVVRLIETGLFDISQGKRPESSDPLGIVGIAPQGPVGRHGANVPEPGCPVIGMVGRSISTGWPLQSRLDEYRYHNGHAGQVR